MYEIQEDPTRPPTRSAPSRPGTAIDPLRILAQFKQWRYVFLFTAVLGVAGGLTVALQTRPYTFQTTATLEWNGPFRGGEVHSVAAAVKLPTNLLKIRERLRLPVSLEQLAKRIDVRLLPGSRVLSIAAYGADADSVKRLADTTVAVLLDSRKKFDQTAGKTRLAALRDELRTARTALVRARGNYDDFRRKNGVIDVESERAVIIKTIGVLQSAAQEASANAASERERARVLRRVAGKLPKRVLVTETEIRPEMKKLKGLESELTALRAGLSPTHPKALALEAEVKALRKLVSRTKNVQKEQTFGRNVQVDKLLQGATVATAQRRAASTRQAVLSGAVARAKTRLARLSALEGRATELLTLVQTAAKDVAAKESALREHEARLRNPNDNLRVLAPAQRPTSPAKSYRKLIAAGIPVGAVLLCFFAWVTWVLWGLRVHTAKELAFWARGPVVASSTWPRDGHALPLLVAELDAPLSQLALGAYLRDRSLFAPLRPLLIIPASDFERPLAEALGARLSGLDLGEADVEDEQTTVGLDVGVWRGPPSGAELRLAVKESDRVLVLVAAGRHSLLAVSGVHARLGRKERIGLLLCNVSPRLADLDSQVGPAAEFWEGPAVVPAGPRLLPAPRQTPEAPSRRSTP